MDLRDYTNELRRRWWFVVAAVIAGVAVAATLLVLERPTYTATSRAFVTTGSAGSVDDLTQGTSFTQQVVKSYADIATTPFVLQPIAAETRQSVAMLAARVTATAELDTSVIDIQADAHDPTTAARIANAVTTQLAKAVAALTPTSSGSTAVRITQIQPAVPPATPSSPKVSVFLPVGALIGLFVGLSAVILRRRADTRLHSSADVRQVTDRPVLGTILFDAVAHSRPLVTDEVASGARAEAFRTLRTNLQFVEFPSDSRTIVVTSSIPGEGKSTTAANLGIVASRAGMKVLVVDADLRRPKLAEYFGLDGEIGLTDVIIGSSTLEDAAQRWGEDLMILPSGQIPPNPTEVLQSNAMVRLLSNLKSSYDLVIFDAPPILPVSDAAILAKRTDGALVISAVKRARRLQLASALHALEQVDAKVLGVVLTMMPLASAKQAGYGYGYSYGQYSSTSAEA